jgi:protein required for attachment to host cells
MKTTWIITANSGRVRFFADAGATEPLQELEDMINPAARLRTSDIDTDRLGPTSTAGSGHNIGGTQGVGAAHNAGVGAPNKQYQPAVTPTEHEAELFAKEVCRFLLQSHQEGKYNALVLTASPQFLGTLRANIDPQLKDLIKFELNKDYTQVNGPQLREQIQQAKQAKE